MGVWVISVELPNTIKGFGLVRIRRVKSKKQQIICCVAYVVVQFCGLSILVPGGTAGLVVVRLTWNYQKDQVLARGLNMLLCHDKSSFCSFTFGKLTASWQLLPPDKKPFATRWFVLLLCSFHLLLIRGCWTKWDLDKVSSEAMQ